MHNALSLKELWKEYTWTKTNMMQTFCLDSQKDRDDGICMLLFTVRDAFQESLGFSPFELVFGHSVGGPFWKKNGFVQILLLVYYIMWSILGISLQEHVK
jgi:hypothetical protein